ncbi:MULTISPECIES: dienelactone hydrolase family protein [Novosphingobium]|uniref:dienelactone hydrolase family protein n=1 Tax=Novosphingobium TaxID=165696 RepID=UPI0022F246DE|nr:dienelactone hydrolase family protein [Novosphingobium resinovorum]GLK46019.1 hypothetical protein GCM10017612_39390 [Novosphingobium resinovorum]
MGDFIKVTMANGASVETYRAAPQGARLGGIVLLQEIFGLTEHIQKQCDRLAAAGYEVLAPSLFDRAAPGLRLSYDEAGRKKAINLLHGHAFELGVADTAIGHIQQVGAGFTWVPIPYSNRAPACDAAFADPHRNGDKP